MKKFLSLLCLASVTMSAQTTHVIDWFMGISPSQASMGIEEGDSVSWVWSSSMPHTVTSVDGGQETFDSGILSGAGTTFNYEFPTQGVTAYRCMLHPSMNGVITVIQPMSTTSHGLAATVVAPNPATDIVEITSESMLDRVAVYNMTGAKIWEAPIQAMTVRLYVGGYPSGSYVVKAGSGPDTITRTVVKQ